MGYLACCGADRLRLLTPMSLRVLVSAARTLGIAVLVAAGVLFPAEASAGAYVRISELAARYGLRAEVDLLSGREVLSNGADRIVLVPGGRQILVNGRYATLEERVGCDGGELLVPASALAFVEANLSSARPAPARPVPAVAPQSTPEPRAASLRGYAGTIVIDPGHGGPHTGARGRTGLWEKDVNLGIARHVERTLTALGWTVIMTRDGDRALSADLNADLDGRAAYATRTAADLFVSIHANWADDPGVQGVEVFCAPGRAQSALLAREIGRAICAATGEEDRGVKLAGFRVIKRAPMPAVLVEVGFISNPTTERRLRTDEYRRLLAEAIVRGIERFQDRGASSPAIRGESQGGARKRSGAGSG